MVNIKFINKSFLFFIIIVTLFIFFSIRSYASTISSGLTSNVLRLHVIANSDSVEDQDLKYKVRDSIINYMNNLGESCSSKEETMNIMKSNLSTIKDIAEATILENGFNYNVEIEVGNFFFPTKSYGDIKFPAGNYDALRIKIGNSSGKNWWCVMFPPLCFFDVTSATVPQESKELLQENLTDEEYKLISESSQSSEFKFRIVELFNSLAQKSD